jgi:hypothetical protein
MKTKFIIIGLSIITLGALLFSGYSFNEKKLYENELQRQYNSKVLEYELKLKASESQRLVALHHIDSLDSAYKTLVARDSVDKELRSIKGSFKSLTSQQLEQKMVEEFNKAQ